jgi:thymidylate kinase
MIVEFVGMMGAGKTTLYRETLQRLNGRGMTAWTPQMLTELCGSSGLAYHRRFWFRLQSAWRSRGLAVLALRHLARSERTWEDKFTGLRWFLASLGNQWTAREALTPDQIMLIDEGLGQRLFNIFVHDAGEVDLAAVRQYARAQPLPDVLVYLTVNPEVALERALTRSRKLPPRFKSLDRTQLSALFANTAKVFDVFVDELRATASLPIDILVIHSTDLTANMRELGEHLDAILSSAPERPLVPRILGAYGPSTISR